MLPGRPARVPCGSELLPERPARTSCDRKMLPERPFSLSQSEETHLERSARVAPDRALPYPCPSGLPLVPKVSAALWERSLRQDSVSLRRTTTMDRDPYRHAPEIEFRHPRPTPKALP